MNIKALIYTWTFSLYWIKSTRVLGRRGAKMRFVYKCILYFVHTKTKLISWKEYIELSIDYKNKFGFGNFCSIYILLSPKRLIWMSNYFLWRSATKWSLWHWWEFAIDIGGELKLTAFEHRWTVVTIGDYHLNNLQMSLNKFRATNQQTWIDQNINNSVCVYCVVHTARCVCYPLFSTSGALLVVTVYGISIHILHSWFLLRSP